MLNQDALHLHVVAVGNTSQPMLVRRVCNLMHRANYSSPKQSIDAILNALNMHCAH